MLYHPTPHSLNQILQQPPPRRSNNPTPTRQSVLLKQQSRRREAAHHILRTSRNPIPRQHPHQFHRLYLLEVVRPARRPILRLEHGDQDFCDAARGQRERVALIERADGAVDINQASRYGCAGEGEWRVGAGCRQTAKRTYGRGGDACKS